MNNVIQSTGSWDVITGEFSISFCPNDNHGITFDGLSIEDMKEIKSLVDILIEEHDEFRLTEKRNGTF